MIWRNYGFQSFSPQEEVVTSLESTYLCIVPPPGGEDFCHVGAANKAEISTVEVPVVFLTKRLSL